MGASIAFARGFDLLDVVVLERRNFLRLAVFRDGELLLLQTLHRLAVAVGDLHVDFHEADGRANGRLSSRHRFGVGGAAGPWRGIDGHHLRLAAWLRRLRILRPQRQGDRRNEQGRRGKSGQNAAPD